METKAKLQRLEQPDLTGLTTDSEFNNLTEEVSLNSADIAWLKNRVNSLTATNLVRIKKMHASVYAGSGTVSFDLATTLGIGDPANWNFEFIVGLEGYNIVGGGYGGIVSTASADITTSVSGNIGYVSVSSNSTAGYHGRTSQVSYACTAIATRK